VQAFPELLELRDRLWSQVRGIPGVVTVGIGSSRDGSALIVFVDEDNVDRGGLPTTYEQVPVILERAGKARTHGE
jgi:hypothetical protein